MTTWYIKTLASIAAIVIITTLIIPLTALANTNGSEIQITDQPDKLILQFGPQWAGVEFELKTDAGVFPVPVVVDATGILKMDLGGSKLYTLSCLSSPVSMPAPQTEIVKPEPPPDKAPEVIKNTTQDIKPEPSSETRIPVLQLAVFLIGIAAATGGLLALRFIKRRREQYDYDYDDDEYD